MHTKAMNAIPTTAIALLPNKMIGPIANQGTVQIMTTTAIQGMAPTAITVMTGSARTGAPTNTHVGTVTNLGAPMNKTTQMTAATNTRTNGCPAAIVATAIGRGNMGMTAMSTMLTSTTGIGDTARRHIPLMFLSKSFPVEPFVAGDGARQMSAFRCIFRRFKENTRRLLLKFQGFAIAVLNARGR